MIARGLVHLNRSADGDRLTPYHVEAGIAVVHATAESYAATDWRRIVELYDVLARDQSDAGCGAEPGDRDLAVARARAGLDAVNAIVRTGALRDYYLLPATLGELSRECGDVAASGEHYRAALACRCSEPERRFIERRLAEIAVTH